jgi:NADPH:quinone reductase-like Zn-dependent oxidoreductase
MKAAVIERPGLDNLKIEELPTPEPSPGGVLVRGQHVGKVCIAL